jgi:thioredoxin reductase
MTQPYDVLIIGGSFAGLSAALTLGRSMRRTLVIDDNQPRNAPADESHGFLTRDGAPPAELRRLAREQLAPYGDVTLLDARVETAERLTEGFRVVLTDGREFFGRKLLLATGMKDFLPEVPGLADGWGKGVLHCPYCHGYELRQQALGILADDTEGLMDLTKLIYHWSPNLTVFSQGLDLDDTQRRRLELKGITLVETALSRVTFDERGYEPVVHTTDGQTYPLLGLYVRLHCRQHSELAAELGLTADERYLIDAGETGRTAVPGLYVAGDMTFPAAQVVLAAASGNRAGMAINHDLMEEYEAAFDAALNQPVS